jgi:hypothetical protein
VHIESTKKTFFKYGSLNPTALAGINHHHHTEVVLEFIHKLKSLREYFSAPEGNAADEVFDEIDKEIVKFRSAVIPDEISEIGARILNLVVNFSPILKRELTDQKESAVE